MQKREVEERRLLLKSFRNINILFFLLILFLLFIVILVNVLMGNYSWSSLYKDLFNSLVGVLIPLVLFNFAYDYLTQKQKDRELSEKLTETMLLDEEVIDQFSTESKKKFIQNSTESILGEKVGGMLYETLIQSYLSKSYQFRQRFKYYISYMELKENMTSYAVNEEQAFEFSADDYYMVKQDLSFERDLTNYRDSNDVRVGFSYKESTLDGLYQRAEFLFRENLWVDEASNKLLKQLDDKEVERFVKEFLEFTVHINEKPVAYEVMNNEGHEGFHLLLDFPQDVPSGELSKVHIRFRMPQLKSQEKFIVVISEPTEDVEIMFMHLEDKVDVEVIPFLNEAESITKLPNDTIKIDIHDWILPRAGVVFVWDDKEEEC
ncbi:hypothetical protein GGQ92_002964 [Gracilibacillus halotolerans]|uniref:Uncharacterized protein n=1 Tax=Gracilibacillus halotolerans TaxID=74386 RepID=A0A841RRB1_9BACI|nr:hypothetical protein [Gracilibacillus halotolerans]MBB6514143.1 hypothetical protein [Gracilibacillus halotolerans]